MQPDSANHPGQDEAAGLPMASGRVHRARSSGWNLLLLLPIVLSLLTSFYNRDEPRFLGFPAFYWLQLSFVIVGVASTTIVYQLTKRRD